MHKLLIIAPFQNTFPPHNGGHLRTANMVAELSQYFEVTFLSLQKNAKEQASLWAPLKTEKLTFESAEFQKSTSLYRRLGNAFKYRWIHRKIGTSTDSALLALYEKTAQLLQSNRFDVVLLTAERPRVFSRLLKRDQVPLIYDAHNVDSSLSQARLERSPESPDERRQHTENVDKESHLHQDCDAVFCCSDLDKAQLQSMNTADLPIFTIPNGVDCSTFCFSPPEVSKSSSLLFCGSLDYAPNKEGLIWFHREVFPLIQAAVPGLKLVIIGRSSEHLEGINPLQEDAAVDFIGAVDSVIPYYRQSAVSIVPLHQGSGTRLKILEAMSLGCPIVSTSKGAEGIATPAESIQLADTVEGFANATIELLQDHSLRQAQSVQARQLVEKHYDWSRIGALAQKEIQSILD